MSDFFKKEKGFGLRYDDPRINIKWPHKPKIISKKDLSFKSF